MSKATMRWNATEDQKLLLLIISEVKVKHDDLAAKWAIKYPGDSAKPTAKALSEHIAKLKKENGGGTSVSTPKSNKVSKSVQSTPSSNKRHSVKTPATSGKRKRGNMSDEDDNEDEEQIDFANIGKRTTPSRRAVAQRKRYTDDSDDEDMLATPEPEIKKERASTKSRDGSVHDSAVEQEASGNVIPGRTSIARSKATPGFSNIDADGDSEDGFMLDL